MARHAFIAIAPILPVFVVLGALLGLLMNQAGLSSWQSWFNSIAVYAGASQFAMVDLLNAGVTFPTIILLTFVLNLRHALMGASLSPWLMNVKPPLAYFSVFFITDESWAVSIREIRAGRGNIFFLLVAGMTLYLTWTTSTALGWHFGQLLPQTPLFTRAVNFLSLLFFISILGLLYENKAQWLPWALAAVLSVLLHQFVTDKWHIIIAGVAGALAGVFLQKQPAATIDNKEATDHES